jgi:hypothetical protein
LFAAKLGEPPVRWQEVDPERLGDYELYGHDALPSRGS